MAIDTLDYIAKAKTFASDLDALNFLRRELRERLLKTPLFDARTFAYHFEQAVWEMRLFFD